ncbi:serine protease filzig [Apis laboriosa]|uniref:serine protease filzig n=1 Tax=Apis laboriosa TaxID=183418 RepID=UPI001CC4DBFB|nr:serine protease filzig [Apis laboriosa]
MTVGKSIHLLLVILSSMSVVSRSYVPEATGRRLFGGYRIVPKACQPTIPSRVKSNEPAICMFNYECSRRNGQVVGACMDGFLFGACCQLPLKTLTGTNVPSTDQIFNVHEIDHVPDIPILLNPDGTPLGMTVSQDNTVKMDIHHASTQMDKNQGITYTKISTFDAPSSTTTKSISGIGQIQDSVENAEKPQLPAQPDVTHLEEDFPALLGQQNILDDLGLPGLLTHSNNNIQNHQSNPIINPVTTLLSPDQILQIADPVDQLPALFSQGLGQNNHTSPDTILLNENGTMLNETNNPDDLFKPNVESTSVEEKRVTETLSTTQRPRVTESVSYTEIKRPFHDHTTHRISTSTTQWIKFSDQSSPSTHDATEDQTFGTSSMTKLPITQLYANTQRLTTASLPQETAIDNFEKIGTLKERVSTKDVDADEPIDKITTTPMTTVLSDKKNELIRVPTITYDAPSGNKKDDMIDKEEIAINHIISILNDTKPGTGTTIQTPNSSINKWVSIDETSKPSLVRISTKPPFLSQPTTAESFPYTFYKPGQSSNYYSYETIPTDTTHASYSTSNAHSSRPSTQSIFTSVPTSDYSTTKVTTTNPPAPTVIVLGPLGTEFTTETTPKTVTRKPSGAESGGSTAIFKPTIESTRPSPLTTKKPSVSTTITHNISTVISNVATNNVVSTSFFSVNVKDGATSEPMVDSGSYNTKSTTYQTEINSERLSTRRPTIWTTFSTWSDKPSFHLKPSTPSNIVFTEENTGEHVDTIIFKDPVVSSETYPIKSTTGPPHCDEETAAPDDLINFPPVRNPNLNISTPISQQEKPTIVETFNNTGYPDIEILSENDIPTPTFIEDDVLTNKVDTFVNKIMQSLQDNFQDLKDIVYNRANATSSPPPTKRPAISTTRKPLRKPTTTTKPSYITTKKPATTKRPSINRPTTLKPFVSSEKPVRPSKPTTLKPKPNTVSSATTKKPQITTKRPRPTKRPTTTLATSTEEAIMEEEISTSGALETTTSPQISSSNDFRSQCGVRPLVKSGRIVGGKAATFGEWPWQVLVREATWLGLFTKNKCGGVLITDKYVITAAHCQPGFLATLVAVFGEFDLSGELEAKRSITRNVRRVIVNRGYNPTTFESDLALLELESPIQFDVHIVPICMPDDGIDFTGRMATVTGWGRLKYNGGVPSVLQEVQVPIIKNSVCQEMFQTAGHSKLILDSFLCAGYANGQKDSCEGDSGGPLVMQRPDGRWFLVGTVSHGITCAAPYLPGVYMRTTYFKPWLQSITGV